MNPPDILDLLRAYESRNVTFMEPDGSWPIVWDRAKGVHIWDAEGKKYLDLTAAFGVAAAGHANSRIVRAGQRQMANLLHAMGDVHPHALKAKVARELSRITFERWSRMSQRPLKRLSVEALKRIPVRRFNASTFQRAKTIFCNSGFEAVEAALKTAMLATGKRGVIVFTGAYHGTGYGTLNATHREHFRRPFRSQLGKFGHFLPFPVASGVRRRTPSEAGQFRHLMSEATKLFRRESIGAILVEPVQGRGGINIPPPEFLPWLRRLCDKHGAVLILDEIYTGFGRTGKWFACEHTQTIPDLICLGKALTGGFPLSACVGRADLMDSAWPVSTGEAIHTSTFLGHPVGCAMALAQIREIGRLRLVPRSDRLGRLLLEALQAQITNQKSQFSVRGLGLMVGLELRQPDGSPATPTTMRVIKAMLHRGFILLPEGEHSNVISFTPPLTISQRQLHSAVRALSEELEAVGRE